MHIPGGIRRESVLHVASCGQGHDSDFLISKQVREIASKPSSKPKRIVRHLRYRIRNLVDEVHKQSAKRLARMVRKAERAIGSKMMRLRQHGLFIAYTSDLCSSVVVNEEQASNTYSCCGHAKRDLGGAKEYKMYSVNGANDALY